MRVFKVYKRSIYPSIYLPSYIHLFQLRLLLRRMMHDPRFIARGGIIVASLVNYVPATSLETYKKANAADASMLCQQNVKTMYFTRSSQSIKIGIDLSIDKSIKIGKSDLIDIDCIDQSLEIDDTLISCKHRIC